MIEEVVQSVQNAVLVREYDWENYVREKQQAGEVDDEKAP